VTPHGTAAAFGVVVLDLGTSNQFELQATHRWAAQLYLHPTTDRLGSPAPPPLTTKNCIRGQRIQ